MDTVIKDHKLRHPEIEYQQITNRLYELAQEQPYGKLVSKRVFFRHYMKYKKLVHCAHGMTKRTNLLDYLYFKLVRYGGAIVES